VVKGIEGRYVKTHLYRVVVHGGSLYSKIWIDFHHKHDNNDVITSIWNVIADVRAWRGGVVPSVNCGRKNKNQYMFALYCAYWIGIFCRHIFEFPPYLGIHMKTLIKDLMSYQGH
jgi:hypothetical protein